MVSLSRLRLKLLIKEHPRRARALQTLLDDPNSLITALAILNNFVNLLASSIATLLVYRFLKLTASETALVATLIVTFYILILGEITPKNLGKNNPERLTLLLILPIWWASRLLHPLTIFFRAAANRLIRLLPPSYRGKEQIHVSEDQIKLLLEMSEERGLLKKPEAAMIERIFAYDDLVARQVMIPRPDVVAIEVNTPLAEVKEIIAREGHSRYPVYERTPDNIVGILYAKDLLRFGYEDSRKLAHYRKILQEELPRQLKAAQSNPAQLQRLREEKAFYEAEVRRLRERLSHAELKDILRPAYFTAITKPINALLREFQRNKKHMAVVIDEFGGMAGIITLEDIVEEIVGEIHDEYDEPRELIKKLSEREFLIDGDVAIDELNERLSLKLPTNEGVTISGLLLHRLEDLPKAGQTITVDGVRIKVEEASEKEILKVRLSLAEMTVESQKVRKSKV